MKIKNITIMLISVLITTSCNIFHKHEYKENPTWKWTDVSSATATFECSSCSIEKDGHYLTFNATIESEITKNPTCTEAGEKTYTAKVIYNTNLYKDSKTEPIAPLGHVYGAPTWEWASDYSTADAIFTCSNCLEGTQGHQISTAATIACENTPGTCIKKEQNLYTATATFNGKTYKDTNLEVLDYGEHKYGNFATTKEATYDAEGSKERICELCKDVDTVAIPKLVIPYSDVKPILIDAKNRNPDEAYTGFYLENALVSYSHLDQKSMTLDEKFEADALKKDIQSLLDEWKNNYSKLFDINDLNSFTQVETEVIEDPNKKKGEVRKFKSTLESGEYWSYSNDLKADLGEADYVTFGFYQDQPGDLLCVNADCTKYLDLMTGVVYNEVHVTKNVLYKQWNQITISSETWKEMGNFQIAIYLTYNAAYGIKTNGEPAYMTSIFAYKVPSQEGQTVIRGANNITDVHTWSKDCSVTEISYNNVTEHGNATKVDIKSKKSVLELKWDNANYAALKKFDYARMYVYAKTTQRLYVSLTAWRNNVVSIPGLEPFDTNNGDVADGLQTSANVVADQWNIIDIPTSYFMQDNDDSFFIELWVDKNEAKDGWLFTDFVGHYSTDCIYNAGLYVEGFSSPTVSLSLDNDNTYGTLQKVTLLAKQGYIKQTYKTNISGFDKLSFDVYNDNSTDLSLYLYKLTGTNYGNAVKGSYLIITLAKQSWTHIEINVSEYFGTYANSSSIMFRVDGAINDVVYFTSLFGKNDQGGHKHSYGNLITEVPADCEKDGIVAHYHCSQCGKNFDESKTEIDSIIIPATGHDYKEIGENYVCSTCDNELDKDEVMVMKQEKTTKQYIFLGSSICNGYHGPNVSEHTSMADFFGNDYLLASYTGLSNGAQVSQENIYLRKIIDNSTALEPYLGTYSYDYDKVELKANGIGAFNGQPFNYSIEDGRIVITGPSTYLYKFNAVYYAKDNVIKKACNGFTLSDKQPRWANPNQEVTDRHSYVGLMEELLSQYSELDVDEFVVQLSTNDLGIYVDQTCKEHVPFGEVSADEVRDSKDFDKDTSFGALEWLIAKAKEVWGCKVTIFTCQMYDADYATYKNNGYDLESLSSSNYFQMYLPCLAIAKKWGTGLIDIYANKDAEIKLNENKSRYKADIVHLTEIGYEAVLYQLFREFFDKQ